MSPVSSASSCSLEDQNQLVVQHISPVRRVGGRIYELTPVWVRNVSFALTQLVWLPFSQGVFFALGLYLGRTVLVRPLMARFNFRQS